MGTDKIRLKVMGLAASQMQQGMFALLLEEVGGNRRIPIVIGSPEAHAIAIQLERLVMPRPLTHDVLCNALSAFDIHIQSVCITRYAESIFYSELTLTDGEREIKVDSRTSDAVAIALRVGCPIFTSPEIIEHTGVLLESKIEEGLSPQSKSSTKRKQLELMSEEELQIELSNAIEDEAYERASDVKKEITRRNTEHK